MSAPGFVVASATPIVDLVALEVEKAAIEKELGVVADQLKEARILSERYAKVVSEQGLRLKHHGAGMLQEDKDEISRKVAAAEAAQRQAASDVARLERDHRVADGALAEVRVATDGVWSALRREMTSAGSTLDTAGKALREGVFAIVHELAELEGVSFSVYNTRAEETPHFGTWEQRVTSLLRSTTDKFTAAHRAIANALNRIAAGSPDLAAHEYLWATLVNDAANGFLVAAARVVDESLAEIRRVLDGGASRPLFAINVKLTASAKLVLAPSIPADLYKLIQPLLNAAFDIVQLPHLRTVTTVQAKAPAEVNATDRPATAGRRATASKTHTGPMAAAVASDCAMEQSLRYVPCLAGHVKAIQGACGVLEQRIFDVLGHVETSYGHLWSSTMPDMTLPQLTESKARLEADGALMEGTVLGDAVLLNTFPVHDALVSMLAQQESKARAAQLAKQLESVASAIEDSGIALIRRGLPQSLLPAGVTVTASGFSPLPGSRLPRGVPAPAQPPSMDINGAAATVTVSNADSSADATTPKQPTKESSPPPPSSQSQQQQQQQSAVEKENAAAAAGKQQQQQHLAPADLDVVQVSPRPSTTPVGTRNRQAAAAAIAQRQSAVGLGNLSSDLSGSGRRGQQANGSGPSSATKHDGPSTPDPKTKRASAAAASSMSSHSVSMESSSRGGAPPPMAPKAFGSPEKTTTPPPGNAMRSPASQARVAATLHMSTPPQSPTQADVEDGEERPKARMSDLDRLAAKEKESMDRLKQLRLAAERRQRAMMDEAPDAPTPQELQRREEEERSANANVRRPAAAPPGATRPSQATPSSGRGSATATPLGGSTSGRGFRNNAHSSSMNSVGAADDTGSNRASPVTPPQPPADFADPEARRRERAQALQRERLQREREMLLEAHRAQEKRREDEQRRSQADMEAKIKQEQQRRQQELQRERDAEERRREAAEAERRQREQQRRQDEQRERELRQRLDELERLRGAERRTYRDERANASANSSPAKAPQSLGSGTPLRPGSRGGRPDMSAAIDPLSGEDAHGHTAAPSHSASGSQSQQPSASALRKKLGLPASQGGTPTSSAPNTGRGAAPSASGGFPAASASGRGNALPPVAPTTSDATRPQAISPTGPLDTSTNGAAGVGTPKMSRGLAGSTTPGSRAGSEAPSSSQPAVHIETTGRSHLEVYKAYCASLNIKPNSGLLKSLPSEPGKHVATINLDLNYIGVRGVRPLIEILRINRGLTLLNLKDNNLENAEVRQIVTVLSGEAGASLTHLDLSNNPISLAGGSAIMDLVARQPSLRTVVLKGTLIQPKVVEKITDAASRNPGAK